MKHLLSSIVLAIFLAGCQTPGKTLYVTLASVGSAVDKAMIVAAHAEAQGKLPANAWQDIEVKHAQFIATYNLACDAAAQDKTKPASQILISLKDDLLTTINSFVK